MKVQFFIVHQPGGRLKLDVQTRITKPKTIVSDAMPQAIEGNLTSNIQEVSGQLTVSQIQCGLSPTWTLQKIILESSNGGSRHKNIFLKLLTNLDIKRESIWHPYVDL